MLKTQQVADLVTTDGCRGGDVVRAGGRRLSGPAQDAVEIDGRVAILVHIAKIDLVGCAARSFLACSLIAIGSVLVSMTICPGWRAAASSAATSSNAADEGSDVIRMGARLARSRTLRGASCPRRGSAQQAT